MDFATWMYPWDFLEEGSDRITENLASAGIDEINLATNYHTVQAFTPHNPDRRTFFARASSYFYPDDQYGQLEPVPYDGMDRDWIDTIADAVPDPISLTSWTVGCHNSRLGMDHRELTIENAHGDDLVFGLCPSKPPVQSYLTNIVRDLADRDHFDRIELETFDYFYGTGFGWHHQKIHVRLGALGEFLFGLCFCEECCANARMADADLDVERARQTVAETLDDIVANRLSHETDPGAWLDEHRDVAAYADVRTRTLEGLFSALADVAGDAKLGYYAGMPSPGREWMVGADLSKLATHVDYYCVPAYESSREAVLDAYHTVEAGVDIPVHVGILPGHPALHDRETVGEIIDGLRTSGVPRVSIYNYGLLPERSLEWIGSTIRS
ncbi:hypothetical protein ACFO5R_00860 [Halosolutus amylolyticus]|uniref:Uncharacterized protein n=1 Tax=Halosolutus amylolyticus TaxID=2932267 RepID=A0ABD5PJF8_9EURY|nr:hypothetical protein [Halosolutus amylolyticus]